MQMFWFLEFMERFSVFSSDKIRSHKFLFTCMMYPGFERKKVIYFSRVVIVWLFCLNGVLAWDEIGLYVCANKIRMF